MLLMSSPMNCEGDLQRSLWGHSDVATASRYTSAGLYVRCVMITIMPRGYS